MVASLLLAACNSPHADPRKHSDCDQVRIGATVAMAASLDDAPIETMERAFRASGWPISLLRETYGMESDGRPHEVQVNEFGSKAFRECRARK